MRLALVLESNTDRRRIEGLAALTDLTVVAQSTDVAEFPIRPGTRWRLVTGCPDRHRYPAFVARHLLRNRYDAVLVENHFAAALGANLASRLLGTPTLMQVRNPMERYYALRRTSPVPGKEFRAAELRALQVVARVNAHLGRGYGTVSAYLADVVRGYGGPLPVEVVPSYGLDTAVFTPLQGDRAALRERLGLRPDAELVFSGSRVAPEKDPDTVLRAIARLAPQRPRLRLATTTRNFGWVTARAAELGIADRVDAADMIDPGTGLADRYRAADVVVQASWDEGFGIVPVEALACDRPVVASAVGGLVETVVDGETGWTFPAGDDAALARALAAVLDDPDEAARRTAEGRRRVLERYPSDQVFRRLVALTRASR